MTQYGKGKIESTIIKCKYCHKLFRAQSKQKKVCFDCKLENNRIRANKKTK